MAVLNDVLGSGQDTQYRLLDETGGNLPPAPDNADALIQTAFRQRPDLASLNDRYLSAKQFSTAERDLWMPAVSALAAVGGAPVRADQILSSWYGAAGANINIPVFNGFLYSADAKEAGTARRQRRKMLATCETTSRVMCAQPSSMRKPRTSASRSPRRCSTKPT